MSLKRPQSHSGRRHKRRFRDDQACANGTLAAVVAGFIRTVRAPLEDEEREVSGDIRSGLRPASPDDLEQGLTGCRQLAFAIFHHRVEELALDPG